MNFSYKYKKFITSITVCKFSNLQKRWSRLLAMQALGRLFSSSLRLGTPHPQVKNIVDEAKQSRSNCSLSKWLLFTHARLLWTGRLRYGLPFRYLPLLRPTPSLVFAQSQVWDPWPDFLFSLNMPRRRNLWPLLTHPFWCPPGALNRSLRIVLWFNFYLVQFMCQYQWCQGSEKTA